MNTVRGFQVHQRFVSILKLWQARVKAKGGGRAGKLVERRRPEDEERKARLEKKQENKTRDEQLGRRSL